MARPLRIQYPGAWYHVTSRGNERKPIFKSNKDREKFLSYLGSAHDRYGAIIHAYCLMDNHYHLLLETPRANLSQILHHINGAYTTYHNVKRDRAGHLFQGRYKAILVEKDAYCQELSRYIHLNPVRAGIVETANDYPWTSYLHYIGNKKNPDWLVTDFILGYFGKGSKESQKTYKLFIEKAIGRETETPLKGVFASTFLGGKEFIDQIKEKWVGQKTPDIRNQPTLKELIDRPSLKDIAETVDSSVNGDHRLKKKLCLFISQDICGYSLNQIGSYFDVKEATVSQSNRRFQKLLQQDKQMMKYVENIREQLEMSNVET